MENKIEIPLNKDKIILLIIASAIFVILAIWMLIDEFQGGSVINQIIAVSGIILFGITGFYGIKTLSNKKTGLIIDENGITDYSNASSVGLIEWDDIVEINVKEDMSAKILLIMVKNPEKYIEKAENKIIKRILKANTEINKTPVSINPTTLRCSFDDLERLLKREFNKNKFL